ncbi:hypothetical protein M413DRAFT_25565 [Hebeloma cylindrosporum]|uniref:Uncharacterized protein n=1 Tax=Hebeloma cylindrosporum TaxID=76867 RepID=A0A0C3CK29_HEBCY|nr:hypothetical protein M413DRAFT_25565 [Hebeloma cylindrosporum h7]
MTRPFGGISRNFHVESRVRTAAAKLMGCESATTCTTSSTTMIHVRGDHDLDNAYLRTETRQPLTPGG